MFGLPSSPRMRLLVVVLAFAIPTLLSLAGVAAYDPALPWKILAVFAGEEATEAEAVPAGACTCPDCGCVCRGGTSPVCRCAIGTCDCPCPHVECGPDGCRIREPLPEPIVPPNQASVPLPANLPGELTFSDSQSASDPLPPAPPGYLERGFEQAPRIEVPDERLAWNLDPEIRGWYRNLTNPGSCVQCSIGMAGVEQNVIEASTLLWKTPYGPAELHGSWPQRVAEYCRSRGIRIYNVTGRPTYDWMRWACRNGRAVAIACNTAHFQTLAGYDEATQTWYVCNNNSPDRIDAYSDAEFRRRHEASASWCVVLDYPPSPRPPAYADWWGGAQAL